ncbi:MAG: c-type cytochrome [Acidobacteriota bacterium]|nr:c-type cytochrome [Acidobacteriota bacterium]
MRKLVLAIALAITLFEAVAARAEQKNVQLLTNLSDWKLGLVMDNVAASLGVHCDFCHVRNEQTKTWDFPNDAKQEKKTAREMIRMVLDLNEKNFHGRPVVGCYTCHLGHENPSTMVALPLPAIPPSKPDTEEADRKTFPPAKDLVAKYVTAIGGEAAAKKLATTSMIAKATRTGTNGQAAPMEVYRSGASVLVRVTPAEGPGMAQMFGAEGGWMQGRQGMRTLTAADAAQGLASARVYDPFMPPLPDNARVFGKETIDGRETWPVGAQIDEHTRQRVWFDATTGLVLRRVITTDSPVGRIPQQTDYEDYREVGGVKVPFTVRVSSVNGGQSSTRKYTSIELGAPVDEKVFAAPK